MTAFDASVLYGAIERRATVASISRQALEAPSPRVTSEACVTESLDLAGSSFGWIGQGRVWAILRTYRIEIVAADHELTERLVRKYKDVPMDFADATLLASTDSRVRVATFDSDSLAYRRDDGTPIPLVDDRLLGWE